MRAIDGHLANHPRFCPERLKYGGYPDEASAILRCLPGGIAHLDHINMEARVEMRPAAASDSAGRSVYHSADNGVFVERVRNVFANNDAKNCCWIAQGR